MNNKLAQNIQMYFESNMNSFLTAVAEHVAISLAAVFVAAVIGIPCGYVCVKSRLCEKWILGVFQILRIIPSLAVLFLLIPVLGTGVKPALTALILLASPPILMNTVTGFRETPEFILETADGLGMTQRQAFWKVKLPLALPYILIGIKTAAIEVIASATLAAKIGAGGLGGLIFTGLGLNRADLLIIGGVSVALLTLTAGVFLDLIDKRAFRYKNT